MCEYDQGPFNGLKDDKAEAPANPVDYTVSRQAHVSVEELAFALNWALDKMKDLYYDQVIRGEDQGKIYELLERCREAKLL